MSDTQTPVPSDHPMMLAWIAYQSTDDYQNSAKWAPTHTAGSMWAAFVEGWRAKEATPPSPAREDRLREALTEIANQMTTKELEANYDYEGSPDYEVSHDMMIETARAALSDAPPVASGGEGVS